MKTLPNILLDSDVIVHFHKGNQLDTLPKIYPRRFHVLDQVKNEIDNLGLKTVFDAFLKRHSVQVIPFPTDSELLIEYALLRSKLFGQGESACMVYAKFNKDNYIASSNVKDVIAYCNSNKITFATTMDILVSANKKKLLSVDECNQFISDVIRLGSKLPEKRLQDYIRGGYIIREL